MPSDKLPQLPSLSGKPEKATPPTRRDLDAEVAESNRRIAMNLSQLLGARGEVQKPYEEDEDEEVRQGPDSGAMD